MVERRYLVIYQPAEEPGALIPEFYTVMRQFTEAIPGRVFVFRSGKSTHEILQELKPLLKRGDSIAVCLAEEVDYLATGGMASAFHQMD